MSNKIGIWIDSSKAIIVKLNNSIENVIELNSNIETAVHPENELDNDIFKAKKNIAKEKKIEERRKHQTTLFLKNVIETTKNSGEIYVFGPGLLKTQLRDVFLKDTLLAARLKAVEKADSMTLFFTEDSKSKSL